ncbi:DNA helicase [Tanacetum coccineum]
MLMNMYYAYQIHDRLNHYNLLPRGGRLFQQYVVTAYCAVEQSRLDYIRQNQSDIRNEYLSGLYDAILRGDYDSNDLGTRTVLTASFTGGPRYVCAFLDALAICMALGLSFSIHVATLKGPELQDNGASRIKQLQIEQISLIGVCTKLHDYIKFRSNTKPFGDITAVYPSKVKENADVDKYISAELPDLVEDPDGYRIISKLMMHGPCDLVNKNAPCMKDGNKTEKYWQRKRRVNKPVIGRLTYIHPSLGDLFYQRRLLCHQKGYRSFRDIRTTNDIVYPTNRAACEAIGLICGDQEWISALEEASLHASSDELRKLFVQILIFCNVSDPMALWQKFGKASTIHQKNNELADLLRETDLIIWDETAMNDRRCFEALDRCLKDILDNPHALFEGKSIILGGISEHEKERVQRFSSWLLDISDGNIGEPDEADTENLSSVNILTELCIPDNDDAVNKLISFIYDEQTFQTLVAKDLQNKVIVCPKNETTDTINSHVLSLLNHEPRVYPSSDEATPHGNDSGETELLYPNEIMAEPSEIQSKTDKRKLVLFEPEIINLRDITLATQPIGSEKKKRKITPKIESGLMVKTEVTKRL